MSEALLQCFKEGKAICRTFPDPIVIIDAKGVVIDGCGGSGGTLDVDPSALIGKKLADSGLFTKEGQKHLLGVIKDVFQDGKTVSSDVVIRSKNGDITVQVIANTFGEEGSRSAALVFHDITCVRSVEQQLLDSDVEHLLNQR